jgi:hypothetical protein
MRATDRDYTPRQAAYDLKKLRGKDWVRKIDTSPRYETVPEGLQTMTALLVLREKVIKPVLAGAGKPKTDARSNIPIRWMSTTPPSRPKCVSCSKPSASPPKRATRFCACGCVKRLMRLGFHAISCQAASLQSPHLHPNRASESRALRR